MVQALETRTIFMPVTEMGGEIDLGLNLTDIQPGTNEARQARNWGKDIVNAMKPVVAAGGLAILANIVGHGVASASNIESFNATVRAINPSLPQIPENVVQTGPIILAGAGGFLAGAGKTALYYLDARFPRKVERHNNLIFDQCLRTAKQEKAQELAGKLATAKHLKQGEELNLTPQEEEAFREKVNELAKPIADKYYENTDGKAIKFNGLEIGWRAMVAGGKLAASTMMIGVGIADFYSGLSTERLVTDGLGAALSFGTFLDTNVPSQAWSDAVQNEEKF